MHRVNANSEQRLTALSKKYANDFPNISAKLGITAKSCYEIWHFPRKIGYALAITQQQLSLRCTFKVTWIYYGTTCTYVVPLLLLLLLLNPHTFHTLSTLILYNSQSFYAHAAIFWYKKITKWFTIQKSNHQNTFSIKHIWISTTPHCITAKEMERNSRQLAIEYHNIEEWLLNTSSVMVICTKCLV